MYELRGLVEDLRTYRQAWFWNEQDVDMTSLPRSSKYHIDGTVGEMWAVDDDGYCLVGDDASAVEHISVDQPS